MKYVKVLLISLLFLTACSSLKPIRLAQNVDLDRFMGDWYVIAYTPTFIDKKAYNGVESYSSTKPGTIDTRYSFNRDSYAGELQEFNPTGFVVNDTANAVWKMQFLWPFKSDYRIIYLDKDYSVTIVGRLKRDYFWIMSRSKDMSQAKLDDYIKILEEEGYKDTDYRIMPHSGSKNSLIKKSL